MSGYVFACVRLNGSNSLKLNQKDGVLKQTALTYSCALLGFLVCRISQELNFSKSMGELSSFVKFSSGETQIPVWVSKYYV